MMDTNELEETAVEARRQADIAKHTPLSLEEMDKIGDGEHMLPVVNGQVDLFKLAFECQNSYTTQLRRLWKVIEVLRCEALYWRQKAEGIDNPAGKK